ncbi:MAG TPA: TRAM domain-containing protein, partial [Candidatus Limiplasma sp.]|nr:TRAM domain-containing protein [Candidatus Limiplasma sp.]
LNKVARISGVKALNINDLANALKPMLATGEEITVEIVREGKEAGQGVAYLDDGTMIVIDQARQLVGQKAEIVVSTVLQTSAGRMIFAGLKNGTNGRDT